MTDNQPQFEQQDTAGATDHFSGTVGTSAIAVPTTPGLPIAEVMVSCKDQTPITRELLYSFDGGTSYSTLTTGDDIVWGIKGRPTQIHIKGSVAGVEYEVLMNREPD